jgi:hypothetical protein
MDAMGHSQAGCTVADQFPKQCSPLQPNATSAELSDITEHSAHPALSSNAVEQMPAYAQTFVCTDGSVRVGALRFPWDLRGDQCDNVAS